MMIFNKDYNTIKKSLLFDSQYYLTKYLDIRKADIDPLKHFCKFGWKEGRNPSEQFDTNAYFETHPDIKEKEINPLVHYILHYENNCLTMQATPELSETTLEFSDVLAEINQASQKISIQKEEELLNYLFNWKMQNIELEGFFSSSLYTELYPDIRNSEINPLLHYLQHGRKEGRMGYIDFKKNIKFGNKDFVQDKEIIIFVSHESSATGAPLLGLNMVKFLSMTYNVIHVILRKANIHEVFFDDSFLIVDDLEENSDIMLKSILNYFKSEYDIKCIICNSVVTFNALHLAYKLKLPTLSLIHEFAEYTTPEDRMLNTVFFANKVITPAKIIQNSIFEQMSKIAGLTKMPSNMLVMPQGKLPFLPTTYGESYSEPELLKKLNIDDKTQYKIIVASGYAQIRKGLDLFIYTAKYIKSYYSGKCKFVWVGDGFNPKEDFSYSLWLEREIRHLGLQDDFVFLHHQQSLDGIFSVADVFCLTSRMDPFPNVVIDALSSGLPIACFKDASGSVEFLDKHHADCILADYLDTHSLGKLIANYLVANKRDPLRNKNIVEEKLNFTEYMHYIVQTMNEAIEDQEDTLKVLDFIDKSTDFDHKFYGLSSNREESILYYISLHKKQLHRMNPNPNPGFSNLKWLSQANQNQSHVPLYDAFHKRENTTHDCRIVPFNEIQKINIRYAVHLHLYYLDLSDEFSNYFRSLPSGFDLFVTIIHENDRKEVLKSFESCGANKIEVIVVPNIGRDIGPMLFDLKDKILSNNYEVIGHFHSKKSISTNNVMGNRWRAYLLENLIGNSSVAHSILSLFTDPSIGLVFAEDRHYMDIGNNKKYLDSLCLKLNIPQINETPLFPLGTMFWARISAIKELFELPQEEILQEEPLPYDGSYMHALERITPHLVEKNNFKYVTVYNKETQW